MQCFFSTLLSCSRASHFFRGPRLHIVKSLNLNLTRVIQQLVFLIRGHLCVTGFWPFYLIRILSQDGLRAGSTKIGHRFSFR